MLRRIIIGLVFAIALSAGPRAYALNNLAQSASGTFPLNSATPSGTAVFGSNVGTGNTIIVALVTRDTANTACASYTITVTDTLSTSFGAAKTCQHSWESGVTRNEVAAIWAGTTTAGGADTVTVNASAGFTSSKGGAIFVYEVKNITSLTPEGTCFGAVVGTYFGGQNTSNCAYTSQNPFYVVATTDNNVNTSGHVGMSNGNMSAPVFQNGTNNSFWESHFSGLAATYGASPTTYTWTDNTDGGSSSGYLTIGAVFAGAIPGGGLLLLGCCTN